MKTRLFWVSFLLMIIPVAGCAGLIHTPTASGSHVTPTALQVTATNLDRLIVLSILAVGLSVAAYCVAPEGHSLSITAGTGAAGVLSLSLLLRVSLWLIPKIVIGLFLFAAIALAYELYLKLVKDKESPAQIVDDTEGVIAQGAASVATIAGMLTVKPAATTGTATR